MDNSTIGMTTLSPPLVSNNNSTSGYKIPEHFKIVLISGYVFILILGSIGNMIVIYVTAFRKESKLKLYNSQIISLAIADLIGSLFAPVVMITHLNSYRWDHINAIGCKVVIAMPLLASVASAWTIVLIAFSRFRIVRNSIQIQTQNQKLYYRIGLVWLLSGIIMSPYSYYLNYKPRTKTCTLTWKPIQQLQCSIVFLVFNNAIPVVILVFLHMRSVIELNNYVIKSRVSSARHKQQVRRISNTLTIITVTFFVLTAPYMGFYLKIAYNKYYGIAMQNHYYYLHYGLYFMSCLNSIANPFFYAKHYKALTWLDKISRVLRTKCGCTQQQQQQQQQRSKTTESTTDDQRLMASRQEHSLERCATRI